MIRSTLTLGRSTGDVLELEHDRVDSRGRARFERVPARRQARQIDRVKSDARAGGPTDPQSIWRRSSDLDRGDSLAAIESHHERLRARLVARGHASIEQRPAGGIRNRRRREAY